MQHLSHSTQQARTLRRWRLPFTLRSVSPVAVAVAVSLLIGGAGFADAATGGAFILGKANKETSTATLANPKGTPLALSAPAGKAPIAVNRAVMVKNLNAQYLGGLTATGLAAVGGEDVMAINASVPISSAAPVVAVTGKLRAGTYYVTATAVLDVVSGDISGECYIAKGSALSSVLNTGFFDQEGVYTVSEVAAVAVTAGDTLAEVCATSGTSGSSAENAGIIAIRVLSSSHP